MSKVIAIVLILFLGVHAISFADNALEKFGRGVSNIVVSPLEVMNGIKQAKEQGSSKDSYLKSGGWDSALTWGTVNGICRMVTRAVVGAFEVVTFILPLPKDYKPILTDVKDPGFFL
ncbi:MAG: exosortase system-associated protein, TIGR04073 family [Candidatus Omnitrophota bacterium]